ncbi:hypothetical protein [Phaeovulum sp. W22_SRMD_FR3]|uniref:hypothetical protein n=1 Tax=Phaeovulum sp. W22_SRMD_FR3 TaxID=3240274 RepID=UPI003F964476
MRKSPYIAQFEAEIFGTPKAETAAQPAARAMVVAKARAKVRPAPAVEEQRLMADGRPAKRSIFDASYGELGFGHHGH